MIETFGARQRTLLRLLLTHKAGMTVDELAKELEVTRNAVRQHLIALTSEKLVAEGDMRPTGGRPETLYVLTDKGKELFPRQYSWLAELVMESVKEECGSDGLVRKLSAIGGAMAERLRTQFPSASPREATRKLAVIMEDLGYSVTAATASDGAPIIEAENCVFHKLAQRTPEVCAFDLALLSGFTGHAVDHQECMAKNGAVCRFRFHPED